MKSRSLNLLLTVLLALSLTSATALECHASYAGVRARQRLQKKIVEETIHFAKNGTVAKAIRKTITIGDGVATASLFGSAGKGTIMFIKKFAKTKLGIVFLAGSVAYGVGYLVSYKHGIDTLNKRLEMIETKYNVQPEDYTKDKTKIEAVIKETNKIVKEKPTTKTEYNSRVKKIDAMIEQLMNK